METQTKQTKTDGKTSIRKIPTGYQKNKINLVLDNSEVDYFENVVKEMPEELADLKEYIKAQISKVRRGN